MRTLQAIVLVALIAAALSMGGSVLRGARISPDAAGDIRAWTPITQTTLSHGRFQHLTMYVPHGNPRAFILLLSGADGWSPMMSGMANRLAQQGAMVAGIDLAELDLSLEADGGQCVYPDGDLENLSHFLQAYYRLPTYIRPILAGYSAGATLAYATLAQAPVDTFGAAVSMEFCPSSPLHKHLCKGSGLEFIAQGAGGGVEFLPFKQLGNPWVILRGEKSNSCDADSVRNFAAQVKNAQLVTIPAAPAGVSDPERWPTPYAETFNRLMAQNAPASAAPASGPLGDLPIVEIAAQPGKSPSDTFAIMLSGDGGWAGLDKEVAAALAADGISVVGLDSLRYFWTPRTPEGLAADLERMIGHFSTELRLQRVLLIGYSQGADVLPFAVNRLSAAARSHVALTAVMGMSEHALFEFHLTSWVSDDNSGPATLPEVDKITGTSVLCIYGAEESDSLCPKLDPRKVTIVKLEGGHHFDGDYGGLARTILASARHP